jgi:hypothetical protein
MSITTSMSRVVGGVDQGAQVVEVAEVGVRLGEVDGPVAVVAVDVGVGLDVLDDRGDPQGGDAELLDVVEVLLEAGPVAAVVAGHVLAVQQVVVAVVAVGEAVDEDLIDDLVAPVAGVGLDRDGVLERVEVHAGGREPEGEEPEEGLEVFHGPSSRGSSWSSRTTIRRPCR